MNEQWQELKETITEMRDNGGICTQQEVCKFLANLMDVLEKQMQEPCEMTAEEYRQRMIQAFHNADTDELIAICVLPKEKEFEHLEWLLKNHYKKESCDDAISRQAALGCCRNEWEEEVEMRLKSLPPVTPQQSCEDIAKAFQFGMALGFAKKHDEMDKVMEEVKKAVIPQPKTGHWIPIQEIIGVDKEGNEISATVGYKCSKCLIVHPHTSIFCPSCGAKMVEPQERSNK